MCTRSASVVALQPCEAFVVTRYELNRFLGSCPELRQRLLDLVRVRLRVSVRISPNPNANPNPNLTLT